MMDEEIEYEVGVYGCDDTTTFKMSLSEYDLSVIKRLVELCNAASTYGCMPTMKIERT